MQATAPGTMRRNRRSKTSRRVMSDTNYPVPTGAIRIVTASTSGSTLTITFNQSVALSGTPQIIPNTSPARTPVSASQPAPNQVAILYSGSLSGANSLTVAYQDPAVRNQAGAYIADTFFNFD